MTILLFLFGVAVAAGLFFILADILKLPRLSTEKALLSAGRAEKKRMKSLDAILLGWAIKLSKFIRMDEYKRHRLERTLSAAGMDMTPEVYLAYTILKPAAALLAVIPCLLIFPLLSPIVVLLSILLYFKESRKAEEKVTERREKIEGELPRFVATVEQELGASRDVLTILENYKRHAGPDFARELDVLTADMRSSSYRRGADDKPEIIPEEAEVVRWIYERYLAGASTRMLRDELHEQGVTYSEKSPQWTLPHIKSILRNEKYCGDVLMQKTFQQDVINRKVIKNTGQLPMYLIENHHEGIVSREKYNAVQAEMARRKAAKSPSKRASTGLAAYTSRYALSDRLVCGECGTLYRRCTWTRPDGKRVVWRCVSRLDYGKKYCHSSPTLDEAPLQQAIIAALNTVLPDLDGRIRQITEALEAEVIPFPGSGMSLGDIDRRLAELEAQFQKLLEKAADDPIAYGDQFKEILDEQTALKELRASILAENKEHVEADRRIRDAAGMLENAVPHITEWDETAIRQLVAQVKVLSKNEISVTLKSGIEIRQSISN